MSCHQCGSVGDCCRDSDQRVISIGERSIESAQAVVAAACVARKVVRGRSASIIDTPTAEFATMEKSVRRVRERARRTRGGGRKYRISIARLQISTETHMGWPFPK